MKCKDCGHTLKGTREYLLAFSCMRCHFCPSCHQKRVVEFGEWLCMDILKKVPHRHFVARALSHALYGISTPEILRRYFLYDRKLFVDLSRCAWESMKVFLYPEGHKRASFSYLEGHKQDRNRPGGHFDIFVNCRPQPAYACNDMFLN